MTWIWNADPSHQPESFHLPTADLAHSGSVSPGPVSPPHSAAGSSGGGNGGSILPDVSPPDRRDEGLSSPPPTTSAPPVSQVQYNMQQRARSC